MDKDSALTGILPFLQIHQNFKPNSIRLVLGRLKLIYQWLEENDKKLSNDSVEAFLAYKLTQTKNNNTVNSYITAFNQLVYYFDHKRIKHKLTTIPSLKKTRPPIDILTPEEIRKLYTLERDYGKYYKNKPRLLKLQNNLYQTLIMFLSLTGCRADEALSLKVKDIDLSALTATFSDTKNSTWRKVVLPEALKTRLETLVKDQSGEDIVFQHHSLYKRSKNGKISSANLSDELKKRAKLVGITKRVYPHVFRHSFITQLIIEGVPLATVADMVGHKDIKSTAYYVHLADAEKRSALLRHPLVRQSANPRTIVDNLVSAIKSFKLNDDPRFDLKIKESPTSLICQIDWS